MAVLAEKYRQEIIPAMKEKFGAQNIMALPRLEKIVVNMGVGEAISDMKILDRVMEDMTLITGQRPVIRRARKSISNFKLREGMPVGCKVTLRRRNMYEFLYRLVNVVLPRIRDFNGVSKKAFDREGNYTLGIKDQSIFPEVDVTSRDFRTQGMDICFVFKNGINRERTRELLTQMGMPFAK